MLTGGTLFFKVHFCLLQECFYWVIERKPLAIQVLSELYKNQGQVGFIGYERVDGKLIRPEAVKTIKMA
ncbi:MAG: phage major capsid protein [Candidatus Syntrophopropionicum ammoniitolerans]